MHIAAALGTPVVDVCRPCDYDECLTGHECGEGVSVGAVVREAFDLLAVFGDSGR